MSAGSLWESVDLDAYLHARVTVTNGAGGRGYEYGIRAFSCPLCGDQRQRGWVSVARWSAGCWNLGCMAEPRLAGGAIEWVRRVEGFTTRGRAWSVLLSKFPFRARSVVRFPDTPRDDDWCRVPPSQPLTGHGILRASFQAFIRRQWGMSPDDAVRWSLGACVQGRHAWRIVIPVRDQGQTVAFQSRTIRHGEPKYLTSRHGPATDPRAECGRPAAALMFNVDAVPSGGTGILVEGPGDVMAWETRKRDEVAVALLGTALTPEKLAMLRQRSPGRIIVALDAEDAAQRRAAAHLEDLEAWGFTASLGTWRGGKDAGSGAILDVRSSPWSLRDRIARRIG